MKDDPPKPEIYGVKAAEDDPHKEIKANLAKFLLSLIQAFLRTGYYTPEHPQSKNAKVGLYEDFQTLLNQRGELTFLARDDRKGKRILVEGVLQDPLDLAAVMLQGMADMYTPKFVMFLERKDLVSLTLKASMSWAEFNNFIDLMGEPTFVETQGASDKERFIHALREKGIFNVSYIFQEELLALEREIPWRSQIALSRLKKDFKMIPLYQDLDAEGLRKVRRQIIQDVVRPIQTAEVIYPILINSDLAETEEFRESEIDEEMIASFSDELLLQISTKLLAESPSRKDVEPDQGKSVRLAKQIASFLDLRETSGRESILEAFYKNRLIPFEHLPKGTQHRIKREREVEKFLQRDDFYLEQFDKIRDKKRYIQFAKSFSRILPELIRRDRYQEVLKILTRFDHHLHEHEDLSPYAGRTLDMMGEGETIAGLKAKFMAGKKETCQAIAPIFVKLGKRSVPHLLSLLEESDDQVVQKTACETLILIDPSNINLILGELNNEDFGTTSAVRIIRFLGDIGEPQETQRVSDRLRAFLNHENPRVREEALGACYKVMGASGEGVYLALLDDADVGVQKEAIQCLGRIKSETGLEKFLEMLKGLRDAPEDKRPRLEAALFGALAFYGNLERPGGQSLEDLLLDRLNSELGMGPLKFLKKKKGPLSEGATAAICETLGNIGTEKSRSILQRLHKQGESAWKNKAEEALIKIAERERAS